MALAGVAGGDGRDTSIDVELAIDEALRELADAQLAIAGEEVLDGRFVMLGADQAGHVTGSQQQAGQDDRRGETGDKGAAVDLADRF